MRNELNSVKKEANFGMNVYDIYKELVENGLELQFKSCNEIDIICPTCKEYIYSYTLDNNKVTFKNGQDYSFYDGNELNYKTDYADIESRIETTILTGSCYTCRSDLGFILFDMLDQKTESYLSCKSPNELIKNYGGVELFSISLKNNYIGYIFHYKNVELNSEALDNELSNLYYDNVYRVALESIECDKQGELWGTEESLKIFSMGEDILSILIEKVDEFVCK